MSHIHVCLVSEQTVLKFNSDKIILLYNLRNVRENYNKS